MSLPTCQRGNLKRQIDHVDGCPEHIVDRVEFKVRLRWDEGGECFFNTSAPISFEDQNDRPLIQFIRECDLLVEVGLQSSSFGEAHADACPYFRIDAPELLRSRFGATSSVFVAERTRLWKQLAPYVESRYMQLKLGLSQYSMLAMQGRPHRSRVRVNNRPSQTFDCRDTSNSPSDVWCGLRVYRSPGAMAYRYLDRGTQIVNTGSPGLADKQGGTQCRQRPEPHSLSVSS